MKKLQKIMLAGMVIAMLVAGSSASTKGLKAAPTAREQQEFRHQKIELVGFEQLGGKHQKPELVGFPKHGNAAGFTKVEFGY